jgi:hypothetical protein
MTIALWFNWYAPKLLVTLAHIFIRFMLPVNVRAAWHESGVDSAAGNAWLLGLN